jgi:hypothetical protein
VSDPIDTWQFNQVCIELQITGTPTGVLSIEGSNQYDPIKNPSATFVTLPSSAMLPSLPCGCRSGCLVHRQREHRGAVDSLALRQLGQFRRALNVWSNATGA